MEYLQSSREQGSGREDKGGGKGEGRREGVREGKGRKEGEREQGRVAELEGEKGEKESFKEIILQDNGRTKNKRDCQDSKCSLLFPSLMSRLFHSQTLVKYGEKEGFGKDTVTVIAGLSNTYADYVTTFAEYQVNLRERDELSTYSCTSCISSCTCCTSSCTCCTSSCTL